MSTTTLSNYKKPPHHRNNSDELDVFEASRYFSDYNDNNTLVKSNDELVIKQGSQGYFRQGRASLDMPSLKHHHQKQQHYYKQHHENYTITQQLDQHHQNNHQNRLRNHQKQVLKEKKQPSSPGGKLAHFLNTLFNQKLMNSKHKKQPKTTQSMKAEDENPNCRKQRRSSISHFQSTTTTTNTLITDTKSLYSSSSSGFRTPPPYTLNTPTKSCQNVSSINDYKQVLATLSKYKIHENNDLTNSKHKNYDHGNVNDQENKKFDDDDDDGVESDASSDLFELQIDYGFGFSSSGLPVYETTCLDNIKRPSSTVNLQPLPVKN